LTLAFWSDRWSDAGGLRVLGFVWLVGLVSPAVAQVPIDSDPFPIFTLGFEGYPDSSPKAPPAQSPDLEARIVHSSIQAAWLWRKSTPNVFVTGAGYGLVRFDMRQNRLSWAPKDLYDIGFALSWDRQLSGRWWLVAAARPHLASDLKNWDFEHVNLDASVLVSGGHDGRGRYGFGAILTSIYGQRLVLPLVQLGWSRRDEALRLELVLPERAAIVYRPKASVRVGVRGRVDGNRYRIGESLELPAGSPLREPLVRYSLFTVGPMVEAALSQSAFLTLEGGVALFRRFDIDDGDQGISDLDLSDGPELKLGLEIRI